MVRNSKTPVWKPAYNNRKKSSYGVGPGKSEISSPWLRKSHNTNNKVFLSSCSRQAKNTKLENPGPGSYEDVNSIKNLLIRNLKRNSIKYMKQNTASQKVMQFIPPEKYLQDIKIAAIAFCNKEYNARTPNLFKEPCKPSSRISQTPQISSRACCKITTPKSSRNLQVMLTGRALLTTSNITITYARFK